jgi:hypothetical protein
MFVRAYLILVMSSTQVFVPTLRAFEVADDTSQLRCSRREVLLHERITCSIAPMIKGRAIVTLSRSFTVSADSDSSARVSVLEPVLVTPDASTGTSTSTSRTNEHVTIKPSILAGSSFRFGYTALKVTSKRTRSRLSWSIFNVQTRKVSLCARWFSCIHVHFFSSEH